MFTCIACTKQTDEGGEDGGGARGSGTPSTKEAVKSLTTQVLNPSPLYLLSLSYFLCVAPLLSRFLFHLAKTDKLIIPIRLAINGDHLFHLFTNMNLPIVLLFL